MKIVIVSDIHDNLVNLEKCLVWCKAERIEKIICPGDVTNIDSIKYLSHNFKGEIFLVSGNAELFEEDELSTYKNINFGGAIMIFSLDNLKIGLCHEPRKIKKILSKAEEIGNNLGTEKKIDFIFYGHTHKPWLERNGNTIIINPGNLSGTFHEATFAYLDTKTKKLELKILKEL